MGIPDKIYIQHYWIPGELDDEWRVKPAEDEQCEEYIRKDALIEWILKGIETSEICHSEYGDACAQAYQAVIDKLNSM